jgi:ABC-2 type transport system ATP-binding protein
MQAFLELQALTKVYGDFVAVRDLSLSAGQGEVLALLGPNGAGKTTTLRMMMGLLQPTSGSARVNGLDCFGDRVAVMQRTGYLPDEPVFYDYLRGSEIVRFVGEMRGMNRAEVDRRAGPLMERLELSDAIDEFAANYSTGMKKKLGLVCALMHDPRLLILDEPTNGLDPFATRTLHAILRERQESGCTVLFSTHLLDQAEKLCTRIAIVHRGQLRAHGTLEELRAHLSGGASLEEVFFAIAASEPERVTG